MWHSAKGHAGSTGSQLLRCLGITALLCAFLSAILVPRFGLVWHEHDDAEQPHNHAFAELFSLLGMFHEEHAQQHAHEHDSCVDPTQPALLDADTSKLHAHYIDDTLRVFASAPLVYLLTTLLCLLPSLLSCRLCWRPAISLLARSPPCLCLLYVP